MEDHPAGNPFRIEHIEHVGVRVPIMDHHSPIMIGGDRQVGREDIPLRRLIINFPGTEVIQPGLSDRPNMIIGRQPVDLGQRTIKIIPAMIMNEPSGVVGMERDTGDHTRPAAGRLHRPARSLDVTTDLDDPVDTDLGCQLDCRCRRQVRATVGYVQMTVGVDDRSRKPFGQWRPLQVAPLATFGGLGPEFSGLQFGG